MPRVNAQSAEMPPSRTSMLFLLCILFAIGWKVDGKCHCEPCGPIPAKKGFRFVGYFRYQDPAAYKLFHYHKLTTIIILGINQNTKDLVCYAHARKVRVVLMAIPSTNILGHYNSRQKYIQTTVKTVTDYNLDGINVDYEGYITKWSNYYSYHGLTSLMKEFRAKLNSLNSLYELSICWVYCVSCLGGRTYDYKAIKSHVDYFMIMMYDKQGSGRKKNGYCETKSQDKFNDVDYLMNQWVKDSGIPKKKLVLALPWYGHSQPCYEFDKNAGICYTKCDYINRAKFQLCYKSATYQINTFCDVEKQWNDETKSPRISWPSSAPGGYDQMNYDDPRSLGLRYDLAFIHGIRGVGSWHISCLSNDHTEEAEADRDAMWKVIPTGGIPGR